MWQETLLVEALASFGSKLRSLALSLGGPGLMMVAIADSSFLSIPEANDILIVILSTGQSWEQMLYYVSMTVVGSVIGCMLLFSVGRKGGEVLLRRRFSPEKVAFAERFIKRYGVFAILIPCMLPPPMPFKIFVFSSGALGLSLTRFISAVVVGRTLRYSMWGTLAVLYGESVKQFMQQNLHKIGIVLSVIFFAILAILIVVKLRARKTKRV